MGAYDNMFANAIAAFVDATEQIASLDGLPSDLSEEDVTDSSDLVSLYFTAELYVRVRAFTSPVY